MPHADQTPLTAASPLIALPGIGPQMAERFARLGIQSVGDLAVFLPSRIEDCSRVVAIAGLPPSDEKKTSGAQRR
jgi:RecG-like helicase